MKARQLSLTKRSESASNAQINVMCLRECSCFARSCQIHKAGVQLRARAQNGQDSLPRVVLERGVSTGPQCQFPRTTLRTEAISWLGQYMLYLCVEMMK